MEPLRTLPVMFHFGGEFVTVGGRVRYVGSDEKMSYIKRDKISLHWIKIHLREHIVVTSTMRFYWLYPGEELCTGLRLLLGDNTCQIMYQSFPRGVVADIYVDECEVDTDNSKDGNDEMIYESHEEVQSADNIFIQDVQPPESDDDTESNGTGYDEDSESSDYLYVDEDNSEEDDEATQLRNHAKAVKKQIKEDGFLSVVPVRGELVNHAVDEDEGNETPYFDSSEEASYEDEGDDDIHGIRRKSRFSRYSGKDPIPVFSVGMTFRGKRQFKEAVIKYGLAMKRHITFLKNDIDRVRAKCSWKGCPWMIYAAQRAKCDWFQVQTYKHQHNCPQIRKNRLVTATRIANRYERMMRANPWWKIKSIKETILIDMFADVNESKVKRAKSIVSHRVFDAAKGQYLRLFDYQAEILRSNPGSAVAIKLDPEYNTPVFQRIYICLHACKEGFKAGCRKVVGLDGCFFKGGTQGELLCAIGRDANNQIYPLAWAVVEKETIDSWWWFVGLLQKDLGVNNNGEGWVFISDQQKGLINAIGHLVPRVEHRMCARHIYANWRKKYRDNAYQKRFWKCAKAPCRTLFMYHKAKLAQVTIDGAKDIMKTSPIHWSRAWMKLGSNCDSVDNNMCKSFNNMIIEARGHPILSMLEAIRTKVMVRIQENKRKSASWTQTLCPNIFKKVNKLISQSGNCQAIWNGDNCFEIREEPNGYKVDLDKKECSCRYWQLAGIPCRHALSAIFTMHKNFEDYIASCFSVDSYNKIYKHCLMPMEGMPSWPQSAHPKPGPPGYVKMLGRPRKKRRRDESEPKKKGKFSRAGAKMTCSLCRSTSHNRRTCTKNAQRGTKKNRKKNMAPEVTIHPGESSQTHVSEAHAQTQVSQAHISSQQLSQGQVNLRVSKAHVVSQPMSQSHFQRARKTLVAAQDHGRIPAKKLLPTKSTRPQRNHQIPKRFLDDGSHESGSNNKR